MSEHRTRHVTRTLTAALATAAAIAIALFAYLAIDSHGARAASLGQLRSQLSAAQAQQGSLSATLGSLQSEIGALTSQIALVQSREVAVRATLAADSARLDGVRTAVGREHRRIVLLRARLALAQRILSAQLVSRYESSPPSMISVVLDAHGFSQLLDRLQFLGDAEHQQQTAIDLTRAARRAASTEAAHLTELALADARIAHATALQAGALAGMNSLLLSREAALADARAAQETALAAVQARGARLRSAISQVQAEQLAAARAAALRAAALRAAEQRAQASAGAGLAAGSGVALGPSGGWAIPYPIVLCESGGQNLPPNGAGASGYYQIIPSTWRLFGGTGPAAYLASKAEQDAVAARIWNGGAGASDWTCSAMVSLG